MVTNLQIKFIKSLQLKKYRLEHERYVCEGEKIVNETILYNRDQIEVIYATDTWKPAQNIGGISVELVSSKEMEKMSGLSTPPQVLALLRMTKKENWHLENRCSIYLDKISDPGNLGTIIRTADWYGITQLFLSPECVDVYSPKVIQSAMGAHFRVHCVEIPYEQLISRHSFRHIYITAMTGKNINEVEETQNVLLVMGSESHGVSKEIMKTSEEWITIPKWGHVESLNVSVAMGIILHQFISKSL